MRAVICTKYGPPDVLQIQEVQKPVPKENEICVKIVVTAVNSADIRVRGLAVGGFMKIVMRFVLGFSKPRKPILGVVYSGVVESIGKNVSKFKKGEKVFGMTGFKFGTYAEYIAINQNSNVIEMPNNATYEEAVSLVFGGHSAIYFLEKTNIKKIKRPTVLIIGATGSVGSAAIQIAHYYDAEVTAVCSSNGKALVESLGVKNIILYDKEDFTKSSDKYDIIFDAVDKTTKKQCKKLLKKEGIYKTVGGLDVASETQKQLEFLKKLYENNKLKAVIDKTFSFENVVDAHKYVETGRKKGNVILKVAE